VGALLWGAATAVGVAVATAWKAATFVGKAAMVLGAIALVDSETASDLVDGVVEFAGEIVTTGVSAVAGGVTSGVTGGLAPLVPFMLMGGLAYFLLFAGNDDDKDKNRSDNKKKTEEKAAAAARQKDEVQRNTSVNRQNARQSERRAIPTANTTVRVGGR
jgi:flagellar biosynthesis component FlhA